ncbi:MAG: DUF971 domain-containing protein [Kiloniellales bacterium]|nr:DUF971 domain-containing protein [Kiloniellales bacterium]
MGDPFSQKHRVQELRYVSAERRLEVAFEDGRSFSLSAEYLRVESPSAEVQGHGPGQKQIVSGRRHVGIMRIEPVGNYAVRLCFDDLHDTGLYSWDYLYELGEDQAEKWAAYLEAVERQGLSRDPPRRG